MCKAKRPRPAPPPPPPEPPPELELDNQRTARQQTVQRRRGRQSLRNDLSLPSPGAGLQIGG